MCMKMNTFFLWLDFILYLIIVLWRNGHLVGAMSDFTYMANDVILALFPGQSDIYGSNLVRGTN